jgi:hypothetical protein
VVVVVAVVAVVAAKTAAVVVMVEVAVLRWEERREKMINLCRCARHHSR